MPPTSQSPAAQERGNGRGRPKSPLLSKRKILDAALELIDQTGLAAFNIPKVAERLQVSSASIYHYFTDRDDILARVGLLLMRDLGEARRVSSTDGAVRTWQDWIRSDAVTAYEVMAKHPNMVPVLQARQTRRAAVEVFDIAMRDLQQGGLRADLCLSLLDAVEGLLLSWVVFENANEANWGFGPVEPSEHPHLAISIKFRSPGTYRLFQSIDALIMGFEKLNAMAG